MFSTINTAQNELVQQFLKTQQKIFPTDGIKNFVEIWAEYVLKKDD
jgi:hypothetical protein